MTTPARGLNGRYIHSKPPPGGRPSTANSQLRDACWRGEEPAESLGPADREHLVYELWTHGWTDVEIAIHTRMTTYTAARIRARLGLVARTTHRGAA